MMKKDMLKKVGKALGRTAVDMAVGFAVQNTVAIPGRKLAAHKQSEKILLANEIAAYGISIAAMCTVDAKLKEKMNPQETISMQNIVDEVEEIFDDVCEGIFRDATEDELAEEREEA